MEKIPQHERFAIPIMDIGNSNSKEKNVVVSKREILPRLIRPSNTAAPNTITLRQR